MTQTRRAGVLMPVSSFEGTLGIGDFGSSAYTWIQNLAKTNTTIWQILPLNPVGYGNSPYQTYSSFAGDEIYISIEKLYATLHLEFDQEPVFGKRVNFGAVRTLKTAYLRNAFQHFKKDASYNDFLEVAATWLDEYVMFIALKKLNDNASWTEWKVMEVSESELEYERFVQYVFYMQWMELKKYANDLGIRVVGDIPIYLGHDSAEVYHHRDQFLLNRDGTPAWVAGVPPDYFSTEGQLWGNPIYDWKAMARNDYALWADRLRWNQEMFDVIRIDHFRAFDTYWIIPGESETARIGEWKIGPRNHFFDAMYRQIENLELVVEDLGDLRPEVLELRDDYDLMGMKIIQFNLNPHELEANALVDSNILVYTGTHDNQTMAGWTDELTVKKYKEITKNLKDLGHDYPSLWQQVASYTLSLNANWAILPIQDLMGLDNDARINEPGTIGSPNWEWKLDLNTDLTDAFQFLATLVSAFDRVVE